MVILCSLFLIFLGQVKNAFGALRDVVPDDFLVGGHVHGYNDNRQDGDYLVTAEAEFNAGFFVTRDEDPDEQWLLQEWEAILQTKSWSRPHDRNEQFWKEKGYVLLCHQLIW